MCYWVFDLIGQHTRSKTLIGVPVAYAPKTSNTDFRHLAPESFQQ
jgi:hypothetical protein